MIQKNQDVDEDLEGLSPLLTYGESALYLRKGITFVREAVYDGELTICRIGKTPYITREELDRYIAERVETGSAARRPGRGRKAKSSAQPAVPA